ncbi:MAG: hypothetical protein F6K14_08295 [Symploca sp. SIO2C1]|nr:hypothetical protein [Symploca sp. SIO2C1]
MQRGEGKKAWGNESADTETRRHGDAENGNPTSYFVHPVQRNNSPCSIKSQRCSEEFPLVPSNYKGAEQQEKWQKKGTEKMIGWINRLLRKETKAESQSQADKQLPQEWFTLHKLPEGLYWDSLWTRQAQPACRTQHLATAIAMAGVDSQIAFNLAEGILTLFPNFDINSPDFWRIRKLLEAKMSLYLRSLVVGSVG